MGRALVAQFRSGGALFPVGDLFLAGVAVVKAKCSEKQRAANRANCLKSTGPQSAEGKARVARNALKHGMLARHVVASSKYAPERAQDFQALLDDLVAELAPRSLVEETLVERIATCYWRLSRAQRYESGAIRDLGESVDPPSPEVERLRRELQEAENALAIEVRFDELMNRLSSELSDDERAERDASFDHFVKLYGLGRGQRSKQGMATQARTMAPAQSPRTGGQATTGTQSTAGTGGEATSGTQSMAGTGRQATSGTPRRHSGERRSPGEAERIGSRLAPRSLSQRPTVGGAESTALESAGLKKRVREMLPDILGKLHRQVDRLREQVETIEGEQRQRRTKHTLLGSLPEDSSLLKVIRYETMLDRQLHRSLDRLERLQRASRRRSENDALASDED